jgi:hypothetical protein
VLVVVVECTVEMANLDVVVGGRVDVVVLAMLVVVVVVTQYSAASWQQSNDSKQIG